MATAKNRANTLQEKFGFLDEDMKNPQHDAIMLWLDKRAEELVREYFAMPSAWPVELVAKVRAEAHARAKEHVYATLNLPDLGEPPAREFKIVSKTWEKTIVTAKNYTVGFADMEVVVRFSKSLNFWENERAPEGGRPVIDWFVEDRQEHVLFEAKTAIASVSEVIRQIRLYQQYQAGVYVVVSPDDRFADVLRGQGIQFVKYDEQD